MKYVAPSKGDYTSGLTPQLLYNILYGFIAKRVRIEGSTGLIHAIKFGKILSASKLWDEPSTRAELEEFVDSYFFTDLREPMSGFRDVCKSGNLGQIKSALSQYVSALEQQLRDRSQAEEEVNRMLSELARRGDIFHSTVKELESIKGYNIVKLDATDSFGQIFTPVYGYVRMVLERRISN